MEKTNELPDLSAEFVFNTSRSSGPGGQNVNKVESRVELRFDLATSTLLTYKQRRLLKKNLAIKLVQESLLIITSQEKRSQKANKENAIKKLYEILNEGLYEEKERIATKPSKSAVNARLKGKKLDGEVKKLRGNLRGKIKNDDEN